MLANFLKSISVRINNFSVLVIFAFFNNLNARTSDANFIFLLPLKLNMLMKF